MSVRELSAALIVSERAVEHALDQLYREYNGEESGYGEDENRVAPEPRGFQLRNIAGGWKLYARDDFAPWVARFVTRSKSATLSKPAYETLCRRSRPSCPMTRKPQCLPKATTKTTNQ